LQDEVNEFDDLLWGVEAIAAYIKQSERRTHGGWVTAREASGPLIPVELWLTAQFEASGRNSANETSFRRFNPYE
jgi:hypothetical protein